jgi:hypothetical protein
LLECIHGHARNRSTMSRFVNLAMSVAALSLVCFTSEGDCSVGA